VEEGDFFFEGEAREEIAGAGVGGFGRIAPEGVWAAGVGGGGR